MLNLESRGMRDGEDSKVNLPGFDNSWLGANGGVVVMLRMGWNSRATRVVFHLDKAR